MPNFSLMLEQPNPFQSYDKRHRKDTLISSLLLLGIAVVFPVLILSLTNIFSLALSYVYGLAVGA
jgi:hypothetical protein